MFQIKDFASIAISAINYAKATQTRITDFTIGSVARTLIEAAASEIEELYQQMWLGLKEGIPVALYQAFNFERIGALPGQGTITLTITSGTDLVITAGTRFSSSELAVTYISVNDVTITGGGTTASILVNSTTAGVNRPVPSGSAFTANIQRFVSAMAAADFTSGTDEETDALRKQRFIDYVQNLARSTVNALQYALTTVALRDGDGVITEAVKYAVVVEKFLTDEGAPIGVVNCYIHNGVLGASDDLIAECEKVLAGYTDDYGNKITGWQAAGITVIIEATANLAINVTGVVTSAATADHDAVIVLVEAAITAYINSVPIGANVILAEIVTAAMEVPDVTNFKVTVPSDDVSISAFQKAVVGTYAIT